MNTPSFTAEASLYKTSRHYRSIPYNASAQSVSPVWPAAEVIEIHDCNPGFIKLGEWPNMTCIPDPNYTGSDEQGDGPPEGGDPTKGGKGPQAKPAPKGSQKCTGASLTDQDALNCESKNNTRSDQERNEIVYRPMCTKDNKVNWCCKVKYKNESYEKCDKVPRGKIELGGGIPIGGGITLGGGI
jgi:hypothetical protein